MVDLILRPIWNWLTAVWSNMADLADRIDDLICSFEGNGDTTMDTVAMLIFAWMVFGIFVLLVGRYIYGRFIAGSSVAWGNESITNLVASADEPPAVAAPLPVEDGAVTAPAPKDLHHHRAAVPPTPPLRKRLSAKGSAPAPISSKSTSLVPTPITTGPEIESVKWVNNVFSWLYSDLTIVNELVGTWILSLNEFTRKSVTEHGVGVEFVRVLPETHAPSLSNVFSDCAPNDDVTITCDCEATPALQLKAFRQKGEKVEVSHYRVNVNRLRARLNIFAISEKLTTDVKFDGWPDIKVSLAPVGAIKAAGGIGAAMGQVQEEEAQLRELISEIVVGAIRGTSFTWNMGQFGNCPRLDRSKYAPGPRLPLHYDSLMNASAERRLLVKVIKATGLGGDRDVHEPYCVIELDEPPQKNQTAIKKGTNCPIWDEHFLYDISPVSAEILFEIYDRGAAKHESKFLGLGIVGIEELMVNPSQRQVIALQSRPYETDDVTGSLTVEFLFIEGAEIPQMTDYPYKLKETSKSVSPTGKVITTTKTVFSKTGESLTNGGDVLTDSALRDLELRNRIPGAMQTSKSTLIIHSVQRQPPPQVVKVEQTESGCWQEVSDQPGTRETGPPAVEGEDQTLGSQSSEERGRSRKKRRDFFGTIKRRLGRSKTRSKSMDPGERDLSVGTGRGAAVDPAGVLPPGAARSVSADRARDVSAHSTAGYLNVPGLGRGIDGNSTRSSLSEASGVSGASTRTYVNEASTLVLETIENGIKRHYLVPITMAQKSKWRKKGVKLHIFNDHTFVAKHLAGGTACQVCSKSVARRIGKQGYECRDCFLKCHKHCHVKADNNCPSSTIHNIELSLLPVLSE